ncbi:unnamed protein product [Arctogadus glacialis]
MATCERDPAAGGPGGRPGSPDDGQPAVPLRPGRAGDPSLLAVPPRAPRTPSYASEWDEVLCYAKCGSTALNGLSLCH